MQRNEPLTKQLYSEIRDISGRFLVTAIGYFIAARIGLAFVAQPEGIATLWLPSGIALAALLLAQNRAARSASSVAIFCACLSANLVAGNTLAVSLGFAFANTLEPILAAVLLTRLIGDSVTFTRLREITALIGVVISANAVTALVGAAVPTLAFGAPFWNTWLVWWVADGLGILVLTPLIVSWMSHSRFNRPITFPRVVEGTIITIALTTIAIVGTTNSPTSPAAAFFRPYSLIPLLIYIALRFRLRGVSFFLLIVSAIVIRQTITQAGVFNTFAQTFTLQLLSAQIFLGIASITTMVLMALLNERALAEAHLRKSEQRFRQLYEKAPLGYQSLDANGRLIQVNQAWLDTFGYTHTQVIGQWFGDFLSAQSAELFKKKFECFKEDGAVDGVEFDMIRKDGSHLIASFNGRVGYNDRDEFMQTHCILSDITERKRAEEQLRESEASLKDSQRVAHVGHWTWDTGKNQVIWSDEMFRIFGVSPERFNDDLDKIIMETIHPDDREKVINANNAVLTERVSAPLEYRVVWSDQSVHTVWAVPGDRVVDANGAILKLTGIVQDITERKRTEEQLRASEERYRVLFREMLDGFALHEIICDDTGTPCDYRFIEVNPAFEQLTGLRESEIVGKTMRQVIPNIEAHWINIYGKVALTGEPAHFENQAHALGKYYEVTAYSPKRGQFATIFADVTARRHRERELEAVVAVSAALRAATTRAEMLPIIVDQVTTLLNAHAAAIGIPDPLTAKIVLHYASGAWTEMTGRHIPAGAGIGGLVMTTGQPYITNDLANDPKMYWRDMARDIRGAATMPLATEHEAIGWLSVGVRTTLSDDDLRVLSAIANIAANAIHRAELHEETERSLERLTALNVIDRAINSSLDLNVTLDILLDQVVTQLRADAAAILLFNHTTQALDGRAERGMRGTGISRAPVYLGNDVTSRAVLNRQMVNVPDLTTIGNSIARAHLLAGEGFIAYYAVPLIAKGHVKGVLEIFQRAPHTPGPGWMTFLESLAEQAALALDNAELFNGLQKTNDELILAYDATIEGWSHALDLRDRETEGHTQRVTEMAIRLAQVMRIPQDELVHLQRGALLHDIGKLGIPDAILLKPDSLTESEWETMRLHPSYAYELLAPIAYLRPAADISYCHHEKWDGTGYPRKLRGTQIPLTARIFAIVDVWDALSSDRPYRAAWPSDQVVDYLRDQAGKHFDPAVVDVFLRLLQSEIASE
ncbi:3'3'-cGAMP-specific phosphodiesterase 2 [Anaerolineae bacterium]|nr:3'3'-cGAMP-specific phosphodiesterase 2 [Anaerolineae bacterium]